MNDAVLLVVAKAPVTGYAKTRLAPAIGDHGAAQLAAAALLDTIDTILGVPGAVPVIALTGRLADAERAGELADALARCAVIPQRGNDFAARLANAHGDVARRWPGLPVLQIGMDTPQLGPELLTGALARLLADDGTGAVLGPAVDGGWWGLGLLDPTAADALRQVPMSQTDTGVRTLFALRRRDLCVRRLPTLSDVDTMADARLVATQAPRSRFARACEAYLPVEAAR